MPLVWGRLVEHVTQALLFAWWAMARQVEDVFKACHQNLSSYFVPLDSENAMRSSSTVGLLVLVVQ